MTEGVAVKTIKLLNKGTEICDVELINYSNEQIPFNIDFNLNIKKRIGFLEMKRKISSKIFPLLPMLSRQSKVIHNGQLIVYLELRASDIYSQSKFKNVFDSLRKMKWVATATPTNNVKVFIIPTSSLTYELGLTGEEYSIGLHALFVLLEEEGGGGGGAYHSQSIGSGTCSLEIETVPSQPVTFNELMGPNDETVADTMRCSDVTGKTFKRVIEITVPEPYYARDCGILDYRVDITTITQDILSDIFSEVTIVTQDNEEGEVDVLSCDADQLLKGLQGEEEILADKIQEEEEKGEENVNLSFEKKRVSIEEYRDRKSKPTVSDSPQPMTSNQISVSPSLTQQQQQQVPYCQPVVGGALPPHGAGQNMLSNYYSLSRTHYPPTLPYMGTPNHLLSSHMHSYMPRPPINPPIAPINAPITPINAPLQPGQFQQLSSILQADEFIRENNRRKRSRHYYRSRSRSRSPSPANSRTRFRRTRSHSRSHSRSTSWSPPRSNSRTRSRRTRSRSRSRSYSRSHSPSPPTTRDRHSEVPTVGGPPPSKDKQCQTSNTVPLKSKRVQVDTSYFNYSTGTQTAKVRVFNSSSQTHHSCIHDSIAELNALFSSEIKDSLIEEYYKILEESIDTHCPPNVSRNESPLSGCSHISEGIWSGEDHDDVINTSDDVINTSGDVINTSGDVINTSVDVIVDSSQDECVAVDVKNHVEIIDHKETNNDVEIIDDQGITDHVDITDQGGITDHVEIIDDQGITDHVDITDQEETKDHVGPELNSISSVTDDLMRPVVLGEEDTDELVKDQEFLSSAYFN